MHIPLFDLMSPKPAQSLNDKLVYDELFDEREQIGFADFASWQNYVYHIEKELVAGLHSCANNFTVSMEPIRKDRS